MNHSLKSWSLVSFSWHEWLHMEYFLYMKYIQLSNVSKFLFGWKKLSKENMGFLLEKFGNIRPEYEILSSFVSLFLLSL